MTDEDALCDVVITAPDPGWLAAFARRLVEDGLAGRCTRIRSAPSTGGRARCTTSPRRGPPCTPAWRWCRGSTRVQDEHPYEVPGFFALPASPASGPCDAWVGDQTAPCPGSSTWDEEAHR